MATKIQTAVTAKAELKFTAKQFIEQLSAGASGSELEKVKRFYWDEGETKNKFFGVRWGDVFALAKKFSGMSLQEVEKLLDSPYYEARLGAVSIMDYQARDKNLQRKEKKNCSIFI